MKNQKYKGIIFDFNGVIWWDAELQEEVWTEFAEELSGRDVSTKELEEHMHGRPNKYVLEHFSGRELSESEAKELTDLKESKYRERCLALGGEYKLSPGTERLFDYLVENNVPHTIATASEIKNIMFFFETLGLDKWFDFSKVVYDDGIIRGKPFPDKYLKAADNIGLNPKDCIVIEDSSSGIKAADAAGIGWIIGLGNTEERKQNLDKLSEVNEVISSLEQFQYDLIA